VKHFPLLDDQQGNRVEELLQKVDMEVFLMNTGRVGGQEAIEESKKVKIPHSSACVKGIAEGTIKWEEDQDFGYMVASEVPDLEDMEIVQPKKLYERCGRLDEYNSMVENLKSERLEYFKKYPKLNASITEVFG